jgi:hypothetical protein
MMTSDHGAAALFWRPGSGALHHLIVSPDPGRRARILRALTADACRLDWIAVWSAAGVPQPGVQWLAAGAGEALHMLGLAADIADGRCRKLAAAGRPCWEPARDARLLLVAADLTSPGLAFSAAAAALTRIARTGRKAGVAVAAITDGRPGSGTRELARVAQLCAAWPPEAAAPPAAGIPAEHRAAS